MEGSGNEFVRDVEAFIASGDLLADGDAVAVALSGGADSVALAASLRSIGRFALHLVHVHHGLRGEAADADAAFVRELAWEWKLPFVLKEIDTPSLGRQWGVGVEEAARRGRYDALAEAAREAGAPAVAVAHHADDQVETIVMGLLRGGALGALRGMPIARPLGPGSASKVGFISGCQAPRGRSFRVTLPLAEISRSLRLFSSRRMTTRSKDSRPVVLPVQ